MAAVTAPDTRQLRADYGAELAEPAGLAAYDRASRPRESYSRDQYVRAVWRAVRQRDADLHARLEGYSCPGDLIAVGWCHLPPHRMVDALPAWLDAWDQIAERPERVRSDKNPHAITTWELHSGGHSARVIRAMVTPDGGYAIPQQRVWDGRARPCALTPRQVRDAINAARAQRRMDAADRHGQAWGWRRCDRRLMARLGQLTPQEQAVAVASLPLTDAVARIRHVDWDRVRRVGQQMARQPSLRLAWSTWPDGGWRHRYAPRERGGGGGAWDAEDAAMTRLTRRIWPHYHALRGDACALRRGERPRDLVFGSRSTAEAIAIIELRARNERAHIQGGQGRVMLATGLGPELAQHPADWAMADRIMSHKCTRAEMEEVAEALRRADEWRTSYDRINRINTIRQLQREVEWGRGEIRRRWLERERRSQIGMHDPIYDRMPDDAPCVRLLRTPHDVAEEHQSMGHCIGLRHADMGWLVHVRTPSGDSTATVGFDGAIVEHRAAKNADPPTENALVLRDWALLAPRTARAS